MLPPSSPLYVPSWQVYYAEYSNLHKLLLQHVNDFDGTFAEKQKLYRTEYQNLVAQYTRTRKKEYQSKKQLQKISHTCTRNNDSSGGTRDCGNKCASSPYPGHVTVDKSTVSRDRNHGRLSVSDDQVCVQVKRSGGNGRNRSRVQFYWHYADSYIDSRIAEEISALLSTVTITSVDNRDHEELRISLLSEEPSSIPDLVLDDDGDDALYNDDVQHA